MKWGDIVTLKEQIQAIAKEQEITLKELSQKAGMNYTGLLDKFRRGSITVRDLEKLLHVLGYRITYIREHNPDSKAGK